MFDNGKWDNVVYYGTVVDIWNIFVPVGILRDWDEVVMKSDMVVGLRNRWYGRLRVSCWLEETGIQGVMQRA